MGEMRDDYKVYNKDLCEGKLGEYADMFVLYHEGKFIAAAEHREDFTENSTIIYVPAYVQQDPAIAEAKKTSFLERLVELSKTE